MFEKRIPTLFSCDKVNLLTEKGYSYSITGSHLKPSAPKKLVPYMNLSVWSRCLFLNFITSDSCGQANNLLLASQMAKEKQTNNSNTNSDNNNNNSSSSSSSSIDSNSSDSRSASNPEQDKIKQESAPEKKIKVDESESVRIEEKYKDPSIVSKEMLAKRPMLNQEIKRCRAKFVDKADLPDYLLHPFMENIDLGTTNQRQIISLFYVNKFLSTLEECVRKCIDTRPVVPSIRFFFVDFIKMILEELTEPEMWDVFIGFDENTGRIEFKFILRKPSTDSVTYGIFISIYRAYVMNESEENILFKCVRGNKHQDIFSAITRASIRIADGVSLQRVLDLGQAIMIECVNVLKFFMGITSLAKFYEIRCDRNGSSTYQFCFDEEDSQEAMCPKLEYSKYITTVLFSSSPKMITDLEPGNPMQNCKFHGAIQRPQ